MRSILLFLLVARCLETIDVCIWRMFVFNVCCNDCAGVCGNVFCVAAVVKNSVFSLGVLEHVVFSVCIVRREAVGDRV